MVYTKTKIDVENCPVVDDLPIEKGSQEGKEGAKTALWVIAMIWEDGTLNPQHHFLVGGFNLPLWLIYC